MSENTGPDGPEYVREMWQLLAVWKYFQIFRPIFKVTSFSIDELEDAFERPEADKSQRLLRKIHIAVLRGQMQHVNIKVGLNEDTWVTCLDAVIRAGAVLSNDTSLLELVSGTLEYYALRPTDRLLMLHALCEWRLDLEAMCSADICKGASESDYAADALRIEPFGTDRRGCQYYYIEDTNLTNEPTFRLCREEVLVAPRPPSPTKPTANGKTKKARAAAAKCKNNGNVPPPEPPLCSWTTVCSNIEEMIDFANDIRNSRNVHDKKLHKLMTAKVPEITDRFENFEKMKKKEGEKAKQLARITNLLGSSLSGGSSVGFSEGGGRAKRQRKEVNYRELEADADAEVRNAIRNANKKGRFEDERPRRGRREENSTEFLSWGCGGRRSTRSAGGTTEPFVDPAEVERLERRTSVLLPPEPDLDAADADRVPDDDDSVEESMENDASDAADDGCRLDEHDERLAEDDDDDDDDDDDEDDEDMPDEGAEPPRMQDRLVEELGAWQQQQTQHSTIEHRPTSAHHQDRSTSAQHQGRSTSAQHQDRSTSAQHQGHSTSARYSPLPSFQEMSGPPFVPQQHGWTSAAPPSMPSPSSSRSLPHMPLLSSPVSCLFDPSSGRPPVAATVPTHVPMPMPSDIGAGSVAFHAPQPGAVQSDPPPNSVAPRMPAGAL